MNMVSEQFSNLVERHRDAESVFHLAQSVPADDSGATGTGVLSFLKSRIQNKANASRNAANNEAPEVLYRKTCNEISSQIAGLVSSTAINLARLDGTFAKEREYALENLKRLRADAEPKMEMARLTDAATQAVSRAVSAARTAFGAEFADAASASVLLSAVSASARLTARDALLSAQRTVGTLYKAIGKPGNVDLMMHGEKGDLLTDLMSDFSADMISLSNLRSLKKTVAKCVRLDEEIKIIARQVNKDRNEASLKLDDQRQAIMQMDQRFIEQAIAVVPEEIRHLAPSKVVLDWKVGNDVEPGQSLSYH